MLTEQLILDNLVAEASKRGAFEAENGRLKAIVADAKAVNDALGKSTAVAAAHIESLKTELRRVSKQAEEGFQALQGLVVAAQSGRKRSETLRVALSWAEKHIESVIPF